MLGSTQPAEALVRLQRALSYFEPMIPSFVPALRVDLARVQRASGRYGEAEAELEAAIRQIESQSALGDPQQQAIFFDYAAAAPFDEMAALQSDERDDPARALHYVERSRGRQLATLLLWRKRVSPGQILSGTQSRPAALTPDAFGGVAARGRRPAVLRRAGGPRGGVGCASGWLELLSAASGFERA